MLKQLLLNLKRLFKVRKHSGAGGNVSLISLIKRGLIYLFGFGYADVPLTLFFNINGKCNLKCKMCDVGQKNTESSFYQNIVGDKDDFPLDEYKKIIDTVKNKKPYISLTTTEPLLYPDLIQLIKYTRQNDLHINITTNGVLLEKFAEEIIESDLSRLTVSIDGDPEIHNEQRGIPGTFEKVISGINKIAQLKKTKQKTLPEIYIITTVTPLNSLRLDKMLSSLPLDDINVVNLKLMVFTTKEMADKHNKKYGEKYPVTENCLSGGISFEEFKFEPMIELIKSLQKKYKNKINFNFEPNINKLNKYFFQTDQFMDSTKCVLPYFVAQIAHNGELMVYTRCFSSSFGNIFNEGFFKVWNGNKMRQFRNNLKKAGGHFPACSRCDGVLYR